MILKSYFIGSLLLVILVNIFSKPPNASSEKYTFFKNKYFYSAVISCSIFVGFNYNLDYQLFCRPVYWSYFILVPVSIWLILFPWLIEYSSLKLFNGLFCGLTLTVVSYILLFSGFHYFLLLIFISIIGIPIYLISKMLNKKYDRYRFDWLNFYAFTFIFPVYLLWYLCLNLRKFNPIFVIIPIVLVLTFSVYSANKMNEIASLTNNYELNESTLIEIRDSHFLNKHYLELVLGLHWKYHTQLVLVDGWRPPFHDPIVGISKIILNPFGDIHYELPLSTRKVYYKQLFPDNKIEFDCRCGKNMVWMN